MSEWNPESEQATEVKSAYSLLPKGQYALIINKAEVKRATGQTDKIGVSIQFSVIDYPNAPTNYKNRKVFAYYCWANPSEIAVKLGKERLADLLFACGITGKKFTTAQDVCDALQDGDFIANVITKKRSDTGEDKNEIEVPVNHKLEARGGAKVKLLARHVANEPTNHVEDNYAADDEDGVPF